jgi:DNA-binding beta-propeller fold protein YncE
MKKIFFLGFMFLVFAANAQNLDEQLNSKRIMLPNGWSLASAGRSIELGDLPLNIAVSGSEKFIAVTNNGQSTQTIQLIDPKTEKVLDKVEIPKSF